MVTRLTAVVACGLLLGWTAPSAVALPPGGPSPDTPGTWSKVSPKKIAAGGRLSFTVGGFPGGETVYLKINDGALCQDTSHGGCVYHSQKIPSSGTVSGYLTLPGDLAPGTYWLRFLASAYIDADNPGKGTKGFSNKSPAFTVTAAAGASGKGSNGGGTGGGAQPIRRGETPVVVETAQAASSGGVVEAPEVKAAEAPSKPPKPPATGGDGLPSDDDGGVTGTAGADRVVLELSPDHAGEWAYVYAYSEPTGLGWHQMAPDGTVTVSRSGLPAGVHRFALVDVDGGLLGWTQVELPAAQSPSPSPTPSPTPTPTALPVVPPPQPAGQPPVAGIAALTAAVVAAAGAVLAVVLRGRRRPAAGQSSRPGAETGES